VECELFRFGVNVGRATSRAEWAEKARKFEDLGYSVLTVPDHLTDPFAPLPALVSAAEATTRLQIGTHVLNNDLRHPVLVAREAATVDLLMDGRCQLGLGAGHMQSEYAQAGLGFDAAGTRVARLAEAVSLIKGLFTGAPVTFAGQHYHVTGHQLHPRPVQRPHPPHASRRRRSRHGGYHRLDDEGRAPAKFRPHRLEHRPAAACPGCRYVE
jgi:probable F420-dependent oxidoreductase